MKPNEIRFYEECTNEPIYLTSIKSQIIPHLGSDIVVLDKRYFVTDVLIVYEDYGTYVDVTLEKVDE